jgi:hypothetical protein
VDAAGSAGTDEARPSPTRMLTREQRVGWAVVAATAAGVLLSWAADSFNGDGNALGRAAIGLGLAVVMGAAVWYGRRIMAAFSAMAAGLAPLKPAFAAVSLVSLVYGAYLLFRNTLAQRKVAMARPRRQPGGARTRSPKAATEAAGAARRPNANRRYTPPKTKNPRGGR